jgi:hypothetical protein
MTSEATAMSNPDSRGDPFSRPPSPITIFRSARSLTSTTRGQVIVCGSMPSVLPRHGEPDRRGCRALAERRGRDGGDVDVLAVRPAPEPPHERERDLGLVPAVELELVVGDAERAGDLRDGPERGSLRDVEV